MDNLNIIQAHLSGQPLGSLLSPRSCRKGQGKAELDLAIPPRIAIGFDDLRIHRSSPFPAELLPSSRRISSIIGLT